MTSSGIRRYRAQGHEIARLNLDDDSLLINVFPHQNSRYDEFVVQELLEKYPTVHHIALSIGDTSCLQNWPGLFQHIETRNNLHKITLTVSPGWVEQATVTGLIQALERNPNIQDFSISSPPELTEDVRVPVAPLISFLMVGSTSLNAVTLHCEILPDDMPNAPARLAAALHGCTNLQCLRLGKSLHWSLDAKIFDGLGSNHSVADLEIELNQMHWPAMKSLKKFVGRASNLRRLVINSEVQIPKRVRKNILKMAKSNFSLREIRFGQQGLPEEEEQQRLQFYADRNEHMEQWIDEPEMVPKHLWRHGLTTAARARDPSVLFSSLIAISGDLGSIRSGRKRKRPTVFDPS